MRGNSEKQVSSSEKDRLTQWLFPSCGYKCISLPSASRRAVSHMHLPTVIPTLRKQCALSAE